MNEVVHQKLPQDKTAFQWTVFKLLFEAQRLEGGKRLRFELPYIEKISQDLPLVTKTF